MDSSLLPVVVGLAVVPSILGIRAYRGAQLRQGRGKEAKPPPLIPLAKGVAVLVGGAFMLNSGMADKTLFEAQVAGTGDTAPVELTFTVPVEHPGARHAFDVNPRADGADVSDPIEVAVRITDPSGAVLVEEHKTLDVRDDSTTSGISNYVWDSWDGELVPTQAGDYVLTVDVLSPHVPEVHVWVGDDQKTDGHRIAGY